MSYDWQEDVRKFHIKMGLEVGSTPRLVDSKTKRLRIELIKEEMAELVESLEKDNLETIADGAADSIYVILGTLVTYGVELQPIWNVIHHANMNKVGDSKRADGKILKPKNWKHPDIKELIEEQVEGIHESRERIRSNWESKLP